jgi:hypothetical protein
MPIAIRRAFGALAYWAALASGAAFAAPATVLLHYTPVDGNPNITISGSVTFNDAFQTPNQNIFDLTDGLIAVSITVQGPGVPGGSTTFTLADGMTWAFRTDGQRHIIDLNFFSNDNGSGCFLYGYEVFLLGFYCGDPEGPDEYVTLAQLAITQASEPVPALDPLALALLSLLLAATAAIPALRRRR